MYAPRTLPLLLLIACTDDRYDPLDPTEDTDTDTGTDTDADSDLTDEALFRAASDGTMDAEEAIGLIADRSGLPVETAAGTWLFGCFCGPGTWALVGDHGGWQDDVLSVTGDWHWVEVDVPDPDGSGYKFRDTQDSGGYYADPLARRYRYDENGELSLVRSTAAHLERWQVGSHGGLSARELRVWVPDSGAYTHLLLAHDGQNLFDPGAIGGGWRLQDSLPGGVLVVGIDNTGAERMYEYTHTTDAIDGTVYGGGADSYLALIEDVIRPKMVAAYGEPEVVGMMGSSLGGLVSFYAALEAPEQYDMAISLSGTMWWGAGELDSGDTIVERYAAAGRQDVALYLDSGDTTSAGETSTMCVDSDGDGIYEEGPAGDNYCVNIQLRDVLDGLGYSFDDDLWHWHEPGASHSESYWAARVFRPLEAFISL